jgi:hypothetical protein
MVAGDRNDVFTAAILEFINELPDEIAKKRIG